MTEIALREKAKAYLELCYQELNKEDLSADQIYNILVKSSEEELKKKLGFWAIPLPKDGDIQKNTNKRYIRKK